MGGSVVLGEVFVGVVVVGLILVHMESYPESLRPIYLFTLEL